MHTTKVTISLVKSSNNNTGRTKKKGDSWMHRPFMWNSGNGKGWDSCRNPVNAMRTIGHGLQDEFLSRSLSSHSPYTGEQTGPGNCLLSCPATHFGEEGTDCHKWPCSYGLGKCRLISSGCPEDNFAHHEVHTEQGAKQFHWTLSQ